MEVNRNGYGRQYELVLPGYGGLLASIKMKIFMTNNSAFS
jgi:hypothetical protein